MEVTMMIAEFWLWGRLAGEKYSDIPEALAASNITVYE
jgi:hypothetical protein